MGQIDTQIIQTFDVVGGPQMGRDHIPLLRAELAQRGLDGLLIPHEDEYNNEYLPDHNERLMWASGFTGSAGAACVMTDRAVMFTDGRYTLQVRAQVDAELFDFARLEDGVAKWLRDNLRADEILGYDPRLHSPKAIAAIEKAVKAAGAKLVAVESNPIDGAWTDRPDAPKGAVSIQPDALAGKSHAQKRAEIAKSLQESRADAAIITAPASVAWLLNLRGSDVRCTPLLLANALIDDQGRVSLYTDPDKITSEIRTHLGNDVSVLSEEALPADMKTLTGKAVIVDPATSSAWHSQSLRDAGATVLPQQDPVALPKARKSDAELRGTEAAHRRDAVPLIRFLHWLDTDAQSGEYDEIDAAVKLETLRHETGELKDLSFETISGSAANGAFPHYRVNKATTLPLSPGTLYLVDSGAQYVDGTTDVTRTVPIGAPTQAMREHYTLVLQGHICMATVRFPKGTTGSNLDALARYPLWQAGYDYDHGTGHGVGVFLGVHEGPQRISKTPNTVALEPGMIVSNEPGYYKEGAYGIRIENLQYVTEPAPIAGGDRPMLGFHTVTLAPFHRALIDTDMLTRSERHYVDAYHARVLEEIGPRLEGPVAEWLEAACKPL
ncbi:aminopeptidase P family protein [Algimonas porphyrae]|uniref:Xaa-Pro aminopeptidase n=1 Tax=Algimonas porphyrae TaxID=1128113 RepID=A0ABQ5UVS1_9PROT|nr:aminopeptidase P family protein [Algimonas porphyrae]GLQ19353.1 Xaa-Pro aminopeptidase [Algimonas porphyrae]